MNCTIVDENNNCIGYESEETTHKEKKLHKSVHGFVVDKQNRLLCRKISQENSLYPGCWSTGIAAHILKGETEKDVLERICDKLEITDKEPQFLGNIYVEDEYEHEISNVYLYDGEVFPQAEYPIISYEYFTLEEIEQLKLKTSHLKLSAKLLLEKIAEANSSKK